MSAALEPTPETQQEEAHAQLVAWLLRQPPGAASDYGYGVYLPRALRDVFNATPEHQIRDLIFKNLPAFADAAWDLCRSGILRPSTQSANGQGTHDGHGFSVTPQGRLWLAAAARDPFIATAPSQLGRLLSAHHERFGDGFHERAQEAVKCYRATAYLGCCAMCGAAAESVLLRAAIAKEGDGAAVLKRYLTWGGRGQIQKLVLDGLSDPIQREATAGLSLLKYWRDDAAHGGSSVVDEAAAFTSILLLVRLAGLFDTQWAVITGNG